MMNCKEVLQHIRKTLCLPHAFEAMMDDALAGEQHQGDPVALPARKPVAAGLLSESNTHNKGWNAYHDELAKLGPLYTRPAQGEPVGYLVQRVDPTGVPRLDRPLMTLCKPEEWGSAFKAQPLYTHAAPDEAEWSEMQQRLGDQNEALRAQVAKLQESERKNVAAADKWHAPNSKLAERDAVGHRPQSGEVMMREIPFALRCHGLYVSSPFIEGWQQCASAVESIRANNERNGFTLRNVEGPEFVDGTAELSELENLRKKVAELEASLQHREEMLDKVVSGWPLRIYKPEDPLPIKTCGQLLAYSVDGGMMTTFDPEKMVLRESEEREAKS